MAELLPQAKASLGQGVKIPERYANGSAFKYGYLIDVEAFDDAHNAIGTFPEASVSYAGPGNVSLSISKPLERTEKKGRYDLTETYQDIQIQGKTDQYLFLVCILRVRIIGRVDGYILEMRSTANRKRKEILSPPLSGILYETVAQDHRVHRGDVLQPAAGLSGGRGAIPKASG